MQTQASEVFSDAPRVIAMPVPDDALEVVITGKAYLTRKGLARTIKKSERTIARWDALRIGPPKITVGRMVLYDPDKLPGWLAWNETGAPPPVRGRTSR